MQSEAWGEPACREGSRHVAPIFVDRATTGSTNRAYIGHEASSPHRSDAHNGTGRLADDAICVSTQSRVIGGAPANNYEVGFEAIRDTAHGFGNVARFHDGFRFCSSQLLNFGDRCSRVGKETPDPFFRVVVLTR